MQLFIGMINLTDTSNESWQDFELDMDIYGPSLEGFEVVYGFQNQVIGKADSALILDNVKVDTVSSFNADYIYSNNAAIDELIIYTDVGVIDLLWHRYR